jgi:hypothetical protein
MTGYVCKLFSRYLIPDSLCSYGWHKLLGIISVCVGSLYIENSIKKEHTKINYLDIAIHHKEKSLEFSIYRKLTQTDIIIPNSSCHPYEHKLSGIKYLLNRLNTYPITKKSKQTEKTTIKNILQKNEYNTSLLEKPLSQPQKQNINEEPKHQTTKWATFAYCRKEDK